MSNPIDYMTQQPTFRYFFYLEILFLLFKGFTELHYRLSRIGLHNLNWTGIVDRLGEALTFIICLGF